VVEDNGVYWKVGYLRASLVSAVGQPALGQWAMGPRETTETNQEKLRRHSKIGHPCPRKAGHSRHRKLESLVRAGGFSIDPDS
jgi:hypothetical protein